MQKNNTLDPMLGEDEVAALLGVSPMTVYRMRRSGKLKAYHLGRNLIRYRTSEVNDWIESSQYQSPAA
jgi:excisionase family DNA binding protein